MDTTPVGIYLEDEQRFESDFVKQLLKISFFKDTHPAGTIVSPFRIIKRHDALYMLIHNYDRSGERKFAIHSIANNEPVINDDSNSYKLMKVA